MCEILILSQSSQFFLALSIQTFVDSFGINCVIFGLKIDCVSFNWTDLPTPWSYSNYWSIRPCRCFKINLNILSVFTKCVKLLSPYKYQPYLGQSSFLLMKTSSLRLKVIELTSLKFKFWWLQIKYTYLTYVN